MNAKAYQLGQRDILFFDAQNELYPTNSIKQFFHFLKFSGINGHIKFAHAHDQCSLHENINIKENIIIETLTSESAISNANDFEDYVKSMKNTYLQRLIKRIYPLDRFPYQLNKEEKKIAILIKSLLAPCDYIFLDNPESNLNDGNLNIFKQSLIFESYYSNKSVLISSMDKRSWLDMATKVVTKNPQGHFECQANQPNNEKILDFIKEYNQSNPFQWELVDDKKIS